MIYYLVSPRGFDAMKAYALSWGPSPEARIRMVVYSDLLNLNSLMPGVYLFSDLERLSRPEIELARHVWETLSGAEPRARLLNNPSRALCRHELLGRLFQTGKNRFRAVRATEPMTSIRFPVFVREEHDHTGNLTPLIGHPEDLNGRLRRLRLRGYPLRDLLVVEFCDTSDADGIFRKYSAIRIGGEILPRHLLFSRNWNLKTPDLDGASFERERAAYLNENPHRPWLEEIFDLAGIDYGRIDYSLLGNEPQVWEINTNPTVKRLTPRLTSALENLENSVQTGGEIPLRIDPVLASAVRAEYRQRRQVRLYRKMAGSVLSSQWVRPILPIAKTLFRAPFRNPFCSTDSGRQGP